MNISAIAKGMTGYPIPSAAISYLAGCLGVSTTTELRVGDPLFERARALVFQYLAAAPNVSQGGVSYSFSDSERRRFEDAARNIYANIGENSDFGLADYGYMGDSL